jgi:hypothetical protein
MGEHAVRRPAAEPAWTSLVLSRLPGKRRTGAPAGAGRRRGGPPAGRRGDRRSTPAADRGPAHGRHGRMAAGCGARDRDLLRGAAAPAGLRAVGPGAAARALDRAHAAGGPGDLCRGPGAGSAGRWPSEHRHPADAPRRRGDGGAPARGDAAQRQRQGADGHPAGRDRAQAHRGCPAGLARAAARAGGLRRPADRGRAQAHRPRGARRARSAGHGLAHGPVDAAPAPAGRPGGPAAGRAHARDHGDDDRCGAARGLAPAARGPGHGPGGGHRVAGRGLLAALGDPLPAGAAP